MTKKKQSKVTKRWFTIHNPETGETARSFTAKFNQIQKPKGWVKGNLPK